MMNRRRFLSLTAGALFQPSGRHRRPPVPALEGDRRVSDEWIGEIRDGTGYTLVKSSSRVDMLFLSPPEERGGPLRLDFYDWETYPDGDTVLLVPVLRSDPEWHVLGPARYEVSLWLGPGPKDWTPSVLILFERPTSLSVYTHQEQFQQIVLLTGELSSCSSSWAMGSRP